MHCRYVIGIVKFCNHCKLHVEITSTSQHMAKSHFFFLIFFFWRKTVYFLFCLLSSFYLFRSSFFSSFLRFLLTFSTSAGQYIKQLHSLATKLKRFIHQVICLCGNVSYSWIVSARSTCVCFLAWSSHCETNSVLFNGSSTLYDWPECNTRIQVAFKLGEDFKVHPPQFDCKGKSSLFFLCNPIWH